MVVGIICQTAYDSYKAFVDDRFFYVPLGVIIVGAIIAVIAFFGCCGAVKENHCMISTVSRFF